MTKGAAWMVHLQRGGPFSDEHELYTDGRGTMSEERPVIVTTEKGLFFGYTTDTSGQHVKLKRARCGIYWATTGGWMELAEVGPNKKSRISARVDVEIRNVTAVAEMTAAAVKAWEQA